VMRWTELSLPSVGMSVNRFDMKEAKAALHGAGAPFRLVASAMGQWAARQLRQEPDILSDSRRQDPPEAGMERVLIVGAGSGGQVLARELRNNPRWKLWPVSFVDDDPSTHGRIIQGVPVLGDTDELAAFVRREEIDVIVVAIPSASPHDHARLVQCAQGTSARVLTMPPIGSILRGDSQVTTLRSVRPVDVLGRPVVDPDRASCLAFIRGKRVLVTGAAGSIGAELATQIAALEPAQLVLLDTNETGLHDLMLDIRRRMPGVPVEMMIASVTDSRRLGRLFGRVLPQIVLHAAAYKHVPAMEAQPDLALETNVVGTDVVVRHAAAFGAERFVLVSTDKAVRPSSVMGATKRLAELVVVAVGAETGLSVCAVRFGNVLGSRGSVIPTFERQIRAGGPVTVTDPRMKRYFMTIPEAVSLIIQAGAFGHDNVTYILDMGEEVAITELAKRVIELHGLRVGADIEIVYTGMRPGEKLYEELTLDFEAAGATAHPKIRQISGTASQLALGEVPGRIARLVAQAAADEAAVGQRIHDLIAEVDGSCPILADTAAGAETRSPDSGARATRVAMSSSGRPEGMETSYR
jgi:FlaA1/EpsC-like NDP-sugar epimerase